MPESAIPAYITSLIRHFEDLRDGTHGGSASRKDKEAHFEKAVQLKTISGLISWRASTSIVEGAARCASRNEAVGWDASLLLPSADGEPRPML